MNNYLLPAANSHFISLNEAKQMISFYRDNRSSVINAAYDSTVVLCNSETFVLADIQILLNQNGCAGMRIYYGMKEDYSVHAVLLAIDENGNDILAASTAMITSTSDDDPIILEEGKRCPPQCPDEDILD